MNGHLHLTGEREGYVAWTRRRLNTDLTPVAVETYSIHASGIPEFGWISMPAGHIERAGDNTWTLHIPSAHWADPPIVETFEGSLEDAVRHLANTMVDARRALTAEALS